MGNSSLGIYSNQPCRARRGNAEDRPHFVQGTCWLILFLLTVVSASAETVRLATFNVSMGRNGPGVLLKHLMSGTDKQILDVIEIIQEAQPDILLLNEFDVDYTHMAVAIFQKVLAAGENGISYPYFYAPAGNEGRFSGLDLDGDGRPNEWADAYGFGRFLGSEGMVLLSRYPIDVDGIRSFANASWDAPPDLPAEISAALRLSSKSHWDVPVVLLNGERLHIFAFHASPPVFDGPNNFNGLRNAAEISFWARYLSGEIVQDDDGISSAFGSEHFVILGDMNSDPRDGEGQKPALHQLLNHPRINDPMPKSNGAIGAALRIGGANDAQLGDPAFDTVEWDADIGNMRVDYALPSNSLNVSGAGVFWPKPDDPLGHLIKEGRNGASNHRLVWVDISPD